MSKRTIKIDESRLSERPAGITEDQWRAKLVYEAHQAERAAGGEPLTETSTTARDAALKATPAASAPVEEKAAAKR